MLKLLKNIFKSPKLHMDEGIKEFCIAEYGREWKYAYNCYKLDGRFPRLFKNK